MPFSPARPKGVRTPSTKTTSRTVRGRAVRAVPLLCIPLVGAGLTCCSSLRHGAGTAPAAKPRAGLAAGGRYAGRRHAPCYSRVTWLARERSAPEGVLHGRPGWRLCRRFRLLRGQRIRVEEGLGDERSRVLDLPL